jgi:hypothetical protein
MAYFERIGIKDTSGEQINPAQEESLTLLRAIFRLLKPLGFVTGSQSNRLSVDVNSGTVTANCNINASQTLGTVSTVSGVTNISNVGNVNSFDLMKAMSRSAYNSGIRANIS